MVERIKPSTPELAERERRAIEQLEGYYPDKVVFRLDDEHKALGKRLSKLYRALGYASRKDMLEAWGFSFDPSRKKNPPRLDYEAVMAEVARRYEGKDKPRTTKQISDENPDLASQIHTLNTNGRKYFGRTFGDELVARGMLDKSPKFSSSDPEDILAELERRYEGKPKPQTANQLFDENPDIARYKSVLNKTAKQLWGHSLGEELAARGLLDKSAKAAAKVDESQVAAVLEELSSRLADVPYDQLPGSLKALCERFPDRATAIKAAQKQGLLGQSSKVELAERGILRLSKRATVELHLRNADVATLAALYRALGDEAPVILLPPDEELGLLPAGVVGMHVDRGLELREARLLRPAGDGTKPGDAYDMEGESVDMGEGVQPVSAALRSAFMPFLEPQAVVESVEDVCGRRMARVRYRVVASLRPQTLLYALWKLGVVTEEDLRGGQRWRRRLPDASAGAAAEGTGSAARPTATQTQDAPKAEEAVAPAEVEVAEAPEAAPAITLGFGTKAKTAAHAPVPEEGAPAAEEAAAPDAEEAAPAKSQEGAVAEGEAPEAGPQADGCSGDDDSERQGKIALLRAFVLAGQLASSTKFPQELLDELGRAEQGDTSVDVEDLARRLNDCTPDAESFDLSDVKLSGKNVAKGRRFSIVAPDGWTVLRDYHEESIVGSHVRPFVIVQGQAAPTDDLSLRDRIIYSDLAGDTDADMQKVLAECGTDDLHWILLYNATYGQAGSMAAALRGGVAEDFEAPAANTTCFVKVLAPKDGPNGREYDVHPYANDHNDSLRFVFDGSVPEKDARDLVLAMTATLKLDKRGAASCVRLRERALGQHLTPAKFDEMVTGHLKPFLVGHQTIFDAAVEHYKATCDGFDQHEALLAGVRGLARLGRRAARTLGLLIDAYDAQAAQGASDADLAKMRQSLKNFDENAFVGPDAFGDDATTVRKSHLLDNRKEVKAARQRLKDLEQAAQEKEHAAFEKRWAAERKAEEERAAQRVEKLKKAEEEHELLDAAWRTHAENVQKAAVARWRAAEMRRDALKDELSGAGLFAFGRKRELKAHIAELDETVSAALDAVADVPAQVRRLTWDTPEAAEAAAKGFDEAAGAAQAAVASVFRAKRPGDTVLIGRFHQGAHEEVEPIEWRVLEVTGTQAVLISERVLAFRFLSAGTRPQRLEDSLLMENLEKDFTGPAFSPSERSALVGGPTLATSDELRRYLPTDEDRQCEASAYAWSRRPEPADSRRWAGGHADYWSGSGSKDYGWDYVDGSGKILDFAGSDTLHGFRPLIRVRLGGGAA